TTNLDFTEDNTVTQCLVGGTFYGSFDGLGHVIKDLVINGVGAGIFSGIAYGEIKNLGRKGGSSICENGGGGGLVNDMSESKMTNCFNTANISSLRGAGGLVGTAASNSRIENCYNTGNLTASTGMVAGIVVSIVSASDGGTVTIKNVYNTGTITDLADGYTAAIVGNMRNASLIMHTLDLNNCYNFADIVGTNKHNRYGTILGVIQNGEPELTNIIATNVYTKPDALILDDVPTNRLIGWANATQKANLVDKLVTANPTMKEDALYTPDHSQSAAFAAELGGAFKHAPGRTPKLAWEE
ncbi:MAG: hypothetical protein LBB85_06680, partial [Dysgonamonadaceae bacterium]|nr:hypothetical protein [Dysgonamonadaceae bacterium]